LDKESLRLFDEFSVGMKSKKEYFRVLEDLYEYCLCPLVDVSSQQIEGFIGSLDNNKNTKRRKYHQLLSFYNFLFENMFVEMNPVRRVPVPKASKQINSDRVIDTSDVLRLLEHLKLNYSRRDYLITLLIATTGMKLSEVRRLKWNDLFMDLNKNIGIMVGGPDDGRYVRVFDFVYDEIDSFRKELGLSSDFLKSDAYMFFSENKLSDYLYNPSSVKPISSGWIKKVHTKACDELSLPLVTSKDLRHYYVMLCIKLGSPAESIKDQLGWSSTQFMYQYNGVVEMLESPINKAVGEFFKEKM
jgi:integrase